MASLTIRKLDEAIKAYLRLRSAGNGRSVEEEVRVILGELIEGARQQLRRSPPPPPVPPRRAPLARPASPDHRRRHRRLQIAGTDPAAEGAAHSTSAVC